MTLLSGDTIIIHVADDRFDLYTYLGEIFFEVEGTTVNLEVDIGAIDENENQLFLSFRVCISIVFMANKTVMNSLLRIGYLTSSVHGVEYITRRRSVINATRMH